MKVRNVGKIMIAKGIDLDRDIYSGESTQVKPGFEQSERILAMIASGAVVPSDIVNIKVGESTVAIQPGIKDPFAEFGAPVQLPPRVRNIQRIQEEQEAREKLGQELPLPEPVVEKEVITSQLLDDTQKVDVLENPKPEPKPEAIDELMEFLNRKGSVRLRFVEKMIDLRALRAALAATPRSGSIRRALEARIVLLSNVPEKFDL